MVIVEYLIANANVIRKRKAIEMVDEYTCKLLGLDVKEMEKIAKQLDKISRKCAKIGLTIFGGSGNGSLRSGLIVIHGISGLCYDGGDGGGETYRGIEIGESCDRDNTIVTNKIDEMIEKHEESEEEGD